MISSTRWLSDATNVRFVTLIAISRQGADPRNARLADGFAPGAPSGSHAFGTFQLFQGELMRHLASPPITPEGRGSQN